MFSPVKSPWLVFGFALLTFINLATGADRLDEGIEKQISSADYEQAHWGLLVEDLKTGEIVYEQDADKLFMPASTTKLFSVAAALDQFGADYRFQTPLYAQHKTDDKGGLDGNLVLLATGDLSMGGRTNAQGHIAFADDDHIYANFRDVAVLTEPNPLAGLQELARQVKAKGVRHIRGDVIIDDRLFESAESTGSGPARLSPIMINDNVVDISITPAEDGQAAKVDWRPKTAAIRVDAVVDTVGAGIDTRVRVNSTEGGITVRGQIAVGRKTLVRITEVPEPASFARSLLIEALRGEGIMVDASPLDGNPRDRLPASSDYSAWQQMAMLTSPPFAESLQLVLKVSHNLHASTLPLLVASCHGERTLAAGLRRQRDFLTRAGVPTKTISFGGGAGGSPSDLVTPRAAVALLRHMSTRSDFSFYHDALPVLGVDGTLASAVDSDSPAKGKVYAKTGTYVISNDLNGGFVLTSKALAGYLTTETGRELAFAFFVNNVHLKNVAESQNVGKTLGKLCEVVYALGG